MTVICPSKRHSISLVPRAKDSTVSEFRRWDPPQLWKGRTVFVIGGGPSLKSMDWSDLHNRRAIGCNDAYRLGAKVVDLCYFGDWSWFVTHRKEFVRDPSTGEMWPGVTSFSGIVATNCEQGPKVLSQFPWVKSMVRRNVGVFTSGPYIGWYRNTGLSAVALAVRLGAVRVVLLGFDMQLGRHGESNWHPNLKDKPNANVYKAFKEGANKLAVHLQREVPHVEIIDANPSGGLTQWPKMPREEALKLC